MNDERLHRQRADTSIPFHGRVVVALGDSRRSADRLGLVATASHCQTSRLRYDLCLVTLAAGLALPWLPRWGGIIPNETSGINIEQPASVESFVPPPGFKWQTVPPLEFEANQNREVTAKSSPVLESPTRETVQEIPVFDWWSFGRRSFVAAVMTAWLLTLSLLIVHWFAGVMYLISSGSTAISCRR